MAFKAFPTGVVVRAARITTKKESFGKEWGTNE